MTHLSTEALARLVDEEPDPAETAHLAACAECAAERQALREQTSALGALGLLPAPDTTWDALCGELREAGLVHAAPARSARWRAALRAAAALLLVAGGGAALAMRPDPSPAPFAMDRPQPAAVPAREDAAVAAPPAPDDRTSEPVRLARRAAGTAPVRRADAGDVAPTVRETPPPATPSTRAGDESGAADEAQLLALAAYIESTAPAADADPVERLAAWEGIVLATGDALERAPASPTVNGYHLLALRERERVLQQVAVNTPQSWF